MNRGLKWTLYGVFFLLTIVSGCNLKRVLSGPAPAARKTSAIPAAPAADTGTNATIAVSNLVSTNLTALTNLPATNSAVSAPVAAEPVAAVSPNENATSLDVDITSSGKLRGGNGLSGRRHLGFWIGCLLAGILGSGGLIAFDFSQFSGNTALKLLFNDNRAPVKDPDYDEAEDQWAAGNHLEAIRLLRDYLQKRPREVHAAIRIAEIYEKDLDNKLAAALEYEEILKQKLPPDRWAWSAIHLCNLYFHLSQEAKAVDLLRRIVAEHGNQPAAAKARKRLAEMGEMVENQEATEPEDDETPPPPPPEPPAPSSNLPPGFRPKK